jgi:phage shock protein PspC (stress-responsive transcriptional regulator)
MHCRSCQHKLEDKNLTCSNCDRYYLAGKKFCPGCGKKTSEREVLCYLCGHDLTDYPGVEYLFEYPTYQRKLYRSSDNRLIIGLLSGIAHKLNLNATFLRILLVFTLYVSHYYCLIIVFFYLLGVFLPSVPTRSLKR